MSAPAAVAVGSVTVTRDGPASAPAQPAFAAAPIAAALPSGAATTSGELPIDASTLTAEASAGDAAAGFRTPQRGVRNPHRRSGSGGERLRGDGGLLGGDDSANAAPLHRWARGIPLVCDGADRCLDGRCHDYRYRNLAGAAGDGRGGGLVLVAGAQCESGRGARRGQQQHHHDRYEDPPAASASAVGQRVQLTAWRNVPACHSPAIPPRLLGSAGPSLRRPGAPRGIVHTRGRYRAEDECALVDTLAACSSAATHGSGTTGRGACRGRR